MKGKYIFALTLLLFIGSCFLGCNETEQRVIRIGIEESINGNAPFTVVNEPDNHRFSVTYSDDDKNSSAFFSFEFVSHSNEKYSWSSHKSLNDNSVFSFKDDNNKRIVFENGAYSFYGEKTIYIYYDNAPETIKNFCKTFSANSEEQDGNYSIYINHYLLVN